MKRTNPIPFNPETLTLKQTKECVDSLRTIFAVLDRDLSAEEKVSLLSGVVDQQREGFIRGWRQ